MAAIHQDPEPAPTLVDLPDDAITSLSQHLALSSLANLLATNTTYKQSLLGNNSLWEQKLPHHISPHGIPASGYAALKQWTLASKTLHTTHPKAQWTCATYSSIIDLRILPPDSTGTQSPGILASSLSGSSYHPTAGDVSWEWIIPGHGARTTCSIPLLGLGDGDQGPYSATCGVDKTIRLWDLSSTRVAHDAGPCTTSNIPVLEAVKILRGHTEAVQCLCHVPHHTTNGGPSLLASGGTDHTVRLWSLHPCIPDAPKQPPLLATLRGHGEAVYHLVYDGVHGLVSGGEDRRIKAWDVETGRCVSTAKVDGSRTVALRTSGGDGGGGGSDGGQQMVKGDGRVFVLTDTSLHGIDPRTPTTPSKTALLPTKALGPTCMSDIAHHMVALGHRKGALVYDLRMVGSSNGSGSNAGDDAHTSSPHTSPRHHRGVVLQAARQAQVYSLHLDAHKLITVADHHPQSVLVQALHGGEQAQEGWVPDGLPQGIGEDGVVMSMACRGSMVVLGMQDGRLGVLEYDAGRLGGGGDEGHEGGRSRFWRSPTVLSEEQGE